MNASRTIPRKIKAVSSSKAHGSKNYISTENIKYSSGKCIVPPSSNSYTPKQSYTPTSELYIIFLIWNSDLLKLINVDCIFNIWFLQINSTSSILREVTLKFKNATVYGVPASIICCQQLCILVCLKLSQVAPNRHKAPSWEATEVAAVRLWRMMGIMKWHPPSD